MVLPSALAPQGCKWALLFLPPPSVPHFLAPLLFLLFWLTAFIFSCFADSASHTVLCDLHLLYPCHHILSLERLKNHLLRTFSTVKGHTSHAEDKLSALVNPGWGLPCGGLASKATCMRNTASESDHIWNAPGCDAISSNPVGLYKAKMHLL